MYAAVIPCHLRTIFPHLQYHYPFNNLTRKTTLLLTKPTGTTKPSMLTPEARDTSVFCCKDFNQGFSTIFSIYNHLFARVLYSNAANSAAGD
jgi:hypothetical protein